MLSSDSNLSGIKENSAGCPTRQMVVREQSMQREGRKEKHPD
jgi:hypothetical protein